MAGVTIFVLLRPDGGFSIEGNLDAAVVRYTEEVAEYAERLEKADERIRNARPEGKAASLDRVERELARVREKSTRRRGARA